MTKVNMHAECSCGNEFNFTGDEAVGQQYLVEFTERHEDHILTLESNPLPDGQPVEE